jgi:penicillin-binding protein 2
MANYLQTISNDWYRQRLSGALICVVAAFLVLLMRLYYLQILEGPALRQQSQNNWFRVQSITPTRGLVFDRGGELLVENRPCFNLSIVLREAENPKEVLRQLAALLETPPESLFAKIEGPGRISLSQPILLRQDIDRDAVAVIEAHMLDLPGVFISVEPARHYIENERASHLLGYLSEINRKELQSRAFPEHRIGDFIGKFGIEKAYESYLHGKRGKQHVEVNAFGRVTRVLTTDEAIPGNNIFLTLDINLQRAAESLLEDNVGSVLAMDPSNGHILAMAVRPAFDSNLFVEGMTQALWLELTSNPFRPLENKALQAQYPPGSTYKIVTAIAGLEEGVITEHTRFFCAGEYEYGDRVFRCWKRRGHGHMAIRAALAQSCDVFFYQVGERLGVDRLARYATACGLGAPTGIHLGPEASGLVPTSGWKLRRTGVPWQGGETLSVSIGQGFDLVTPIQMLSLVAAVANGGTRLKPLVVSRIETPDGSLVKEEQPVPLGRLPASQKTLEIVRRGLIDAVNKPSGTGWVAHIPGVDVAGKTGTAQVIAMEEDDEGKKSAEPASLKERDHAWFVAFAPAEEPKVAVVVMIEHGGHGSRAAGPVAREVIKTYLGELKSEEVVEFAGGNGASLDARHD